jgi:hypothetical protein
MSVPRNSTTQSGDMYTRSISDASTLRRLGDRNASADSFVSNMMDDLPMDSTLGAMDSQTDLPTPEEDMSEARLRQLYDEEEIERFLYLFSAVSSCVAHRWTVYSDELQVCYGSETTWCFG